MSGSEIYVRFGEVPSSGYSRNDETDSLEAGVSCYRATLNSDGDILTVIAPDELSANTALYLWGQRGDIYQLSGDLVGIGGDGEPLLTSVTAGLLAGIEDVTYTIEEN